METFIPVFMFYVFAALAVGSAMAVISARNPVHSVFFLIFAFFNVAGLFILLGAEYLAMTLIIVYVGAVAVLFLFVVMMLNVNFEELRAQFKRHAKIGIAMALFIFAALVFASYHSTSRVSVLAEAKNSIPNALDVPNTQALGRILYTDYIYVFQISGLILLVAMIGAITLTLRHRPDVKRQRIAAQIARTRHQGVEVVKVESGQGI